MSVAFVDTSVLVALTFNEPSASKLAERLGGFSLVLASDLAEAEIRSVCRRENVAVDENLLDQITLILPPRSLRQEIERVLVAGYVRGADCFHLATALLVAPEPSELTFLTLDRRQRDVANTLRFRN